MSAKIELSNLSIDELNKLAGDIEKEIKRKQKSQVRDIRQQMEKLANSAGLTLEQVLSANKRKSNKPVGQPKYRNPDDPEETWTGRGKRPKWFLNALSKKISADDMLI